MNAPSDGIRSGESLISGQYRLGELLGTGGSASVFAATDVTSGETVALKILHPHLSRSEPLREGFFAEARAAANLRHGNVAAVLGVGVHTALNTDTGEEPLAWIALERAAGISLAEHVERFGALDVTHALTVVGGVLQGLEAAHAVGLIHRDISPANIMVAVDADGIIRSSGVRLVDFGLADAAGRPVLGTDVLRSTAADDDVATAEMGILGSANYMSPEQARGGAVDERGDLYQVGCVLHFALTGRPPFTRDSAELVMRAHAQAPPPVPSVLFSGIPRAADRLVVKAMLKDPASRFASAGEMFTAVSELSASLSFLTPDAATTVDRSIDRSPLPDGTDRTRVFGADSVGGDLEALFGSALGAESTDPNDSKTTVFPRLRARPGGPGSTTVPNAYVEPNPFDLALAGAGTESDFAGHPQTTTVRSNGTVIWIGAVILASVIAVAWILAVSGAAPTTLAVASPSASASPAVSASPSSRPSVSASPTESVALPDLTSLSLSEARTALLAAGLKMGIVTSTNSTRVADTVLSASAQSAPLVAGASLNAGQAVDLVVASGSNMVPAIAGMQQAAAVAAVQSAGFAVQIVQQPNTSMAPGTVVGSTPGNGTVQQLASTVTIAVASASQPSATPSASPSPSASPRPSTSASPSATPTPSIAVTPPISVVPRTN